MQNRGTGKYYEEFNIGEKFMTPSRTVTEADIVGFAGISGDYNPVHTDEEFAKKLPFGGRIAHGMLTLAIISGLVFRTGLLDGTTIALLGMNCKFLRPVKAGDTITCEIEVVEKRETPKNDRGAVSLRRIAKNQRGEIIVQSNADLLMARKHS